MVYHCFATTNLVGGLEHVLLSIELGIWNNHPNGFIFLRGGETTNQKTMAETYDLPSGKQTVCHGKYCPADLTKIFNHIWKHRRPLRPRWRRTQDSKHLNTVTQWNDMKRSLGFVYKWETPLGIVMLNDSIIRFEILRRYETRWLKAV